MSYRNAGVQHIVFMRSVVAVFATASIVLVGCSKRDSAREDARGSDSAVVATSAASAPVVVREAGVRFDPPLSWPRERYRVDAKSGADAAAEQTDATHWVALHYRPAQPDHSEASLCRIVVLARDAWMRADAESGPPIGTMIDSIGDWVYVAQLPQSNPYPPESIDGVQFDAMRLPIRDVRARFSIEGDGPHTVRDPDAGEL